MEKLGNDQSVRRTRGRIGRNTLVLTPVFAAASLLAAVMAHATTPPSQSPITQPKPQVASLSASVKRIDWLATLPVARYLATPSDIANSQRATDILTAQCMRGFGLSWSAPQESTADQISILNSRRYGVTTMQDAVSDGYELPFEARYRQSLATTESAQETLALIGAPLGHDGQPVVAAFVKGKAVPTGGCLTQARQEINGTAANFARSPAAQKVSEQSFASSLLDTRLGGAFKQWSQCMSGRGFHYSTPLQSAGDPRWTYPASALERATAVADVSCASASGVDTTWHDVETAIQNRLLASTDGASLQSEQLAVAKLEARSVSAMRAAGVVPQ